MKLKKFLAGAMAVVMAASTLLVAPVVTKAAPVEEESKVAGATWNDPIETNPVLENQKTAGVAIADGDEIVWTITVNKAIAGNGAIFWIESLDMGGWCTMTSYNDMWGSTNVTDIQSSLTGFTDNLFPEGHTYTVSLKRTGNAFAATFKNAENQVLLTHSFSITDCPEAPTFYLFVKWGEIAYSVTRNGENVDMPDLRGYSWEGLSYTQTSSKAPLVDGSKLVWTLDVSKNVGGDGAIYWVEGTYTVDGVVKYIDVPSYVKPWGTSLEEIECSVEGDVFDLIQEGNAYTVTLTREGNVFTAEHKNVTTNQVVLTQSFTVPDCTAEPMFQVIVKYGEMDCAYEIPALSVDITGENNKVLVGESVQLSATVAPATTTDEVTVTWSSSDTAIATVDANGKVTGVGEGTATITAKVSDTLYKTYDVEVSTKKVPLESITVTADKTELDLKGTAKLTVTYNPADTTDPKTVTWSSSNEKVATVKDGVVTAVGYGDATITATVGTKTATVKISVPTTPATGLELKADKTDLKVGDTATVTATVTPADTTDVLSMVSSNTDVITVGADGKVTAVGAGEAKVTATVGTLTKEITFKVTETSEIKLGNLEGGAWWTAHTAGVKIEAGKSYTFTFDAKSTDSTQAWFCPSYVIYTNSEAKVNNDSADYKEYLVCRADNWAWSPNGDTGAAALGDGYKFATDKLPEQEDWVAAYKEAMAAGAKGTITAKLSGKSLIVTYKIAGVETTATIPVDTSKPVYLSLTAEKANITDITATIKTLPKQGDINIVVPMTLVLLGGAVVIVASKKRFA